MADQNDIEVRFGADTSGLDAAARQNAQMLQGVSDKMASTQDAAKKLDDQLTRFMTSLDKSYASAVKFNQGIGLLEENLSAGNISMAQHDAMLATITSKYGPAAKGAETAAHSTLNFGMSTSHAINGVRALTDELSSGRIHQAQGTFTRLMLEMASSSPAAAGGIMAIVGALALLADGAAHAESLARALNHVEVAFTATGRSSEFTQDEIKQMIEYLSSMPGISRKAADDTVSELARIPGLSRPIFSEVIGLVADFAAATGKKAPEAASILGEALKNPEQGAKRLNDALHFLSAGQMENIRIMSQHGEKAQAQQIIIDELTKRIQGLSDAHTDLENAENHVGAAWDHLMDSFSNSSVLSTVLYTISALIDKTHALAAAMAMVAAQQSGMSASDVQGQADYLNNQLDEQRKKPKPPKLANTPTKADKKQADDAALDSGLAAARQASPFLKERERIEAKISEIKSGLMVAEQRHDEAHVQQLQQGLKAAERELALAKERDAHRGVHKPKKVPGQATKMDEWRSQALAMQDNGSGQKDYQAQIDFWKSKLPEAARQGSKAVLEVQNEIHRLSIQQSRQDYEAQIAGLRTKQVAAKNDYTEQLKIEDQILAATKKHYGEASTQYQSELQRRLRMQLEFATQTAKNEEAEDARKLKQFDADLKAEQTAAQSKVKTHQITEQQLTLLELQEEQRRYDEHKKYLDKEKTDFAKQPEQEKGVLDRIATLNAQHTTTLAKLYAKLAEEMKKPWDEYSHAMESSLNSSLTRMLRNQETFKQAVLNIGGSMLDTFIAQETHKLIFHQTAEAAKTGATVAGTSIRTGVEASAAATSTAIQGASTAKIIMMKAWEAAASVYASIAAIPYVGPFLAPAMAIGAAYEIGHYVSNINSAAGGWEVPYDQVMQVHKNEVVLPAKWSNRLATLADSQTAANTGGQGGGVSPNITVQINNPNYKSKIDMNDHADQIVQVIKKAYRDGAFYKR